jgi:integrase/recombinase XerD
MKRKELVAVPGTPDALRNRLLAYLDWLRVRNSTPIALDNNRVQVLRFVEWSEARGAERSAQLTPEQVQAYQRHIYDHRTKEDRPLGRTSQATLILATRAFLRWLLAQKLIAQDLAEEIQPPRAGRHLPRTLTVEEVERVIHGVDTTSALGVRNRAMLELLWSTGLRQTELRLLDLHDVDLDEGTVHVRQGKGHKDRIVPMGPRAVAWLSKYRDEARPLLARRRDAGTFFLADDGGAPSPMLVKRMVRAAFTAAGITQRGGAHLFRHAMASASSTEKASFQTSLGRK